MRSLKKQSVRQLTSAIMAIVITATTTFQMPITSLATEEESSSIVESQTVKEETQESSSESVTQGQTNMETEIQTGEESETTIETTIAKSYESYKESYEEEKNTFSSEIDSSGEDTEEPSANETRGPDVDMDPFASLDLSTGFTEEQLGAIEFSSKRLLVAADASVIIDPEHVLSSYAGVYLMQYDTETQAKYAYAYYYGKSEFVDVDTVISVADGDNSANAAVPMAAEENPIAELQAAVEKNPIQAIGAIAIIDTGVNDVGNVTESVSMIGDNTVDENGHGTKMAHLITEQNPNVSILSIKALGADGTGDVSAVYAAIRYAIDKKVSVINLSMSAVSTAENAALTSIIDEATAAGIAVVGAAGNNGRDARFYIPGNIESAYIIGAANEDGARIPTSNYGSTVDFNVIANSTSEATAKFSGYYTLNGAVADQKLVFSTDYMNEADFNFDGPNITHQISYYNYKKNMTDLIWIAKREAKSILNKDGNFTTYIGFAEDSSKVQQLDVCVDFMNTVNEHVITDECEIDLESMTVTIPAIYKDASITVRWYMSNASYGYAYDVDAKYVLSDTPEPFKAAAYSNDTITGLDFARAKQFVAGTYSTGFTHTPDSMNHCEVNYSLENINAGDYFTINNGYLVCVDGTVNMASNITSIFGTNAVEYYEKQNGVNVPTAATLPIFFLTHFSNVTRMDNGADVSNLFNTIGGKGKGTLHIDTTKDGHVDSEINANLGWVFGTCAFDFLEGSVPSFQPGGQIICTSKDPDGTAYFFYYCKSEKAQWAGGSFSLTPVLPKTGYLQVHKTSANPKMTSGNSCYNFDIIDYSVFSDKACTIEKARVNLNEKGFSDMIELPIGTYYVRETTNTEGSGYYSDGKSYEITVTANATVQTPVIAEVVDVPMSDPFGIRINKINSDGTTTADLSGAEYEIKYYANQYNSVSQLPAKATYTWRIVTKKNSLGAYSARLDNEHVISGTSVYGKNAVGCYMIPLGTITIEEKVAPVGFTIQGATVSSAKDGTIIPGINGIYLFNLVNETSGISLKSGNTLNTLVENEKDVSITYAEVQNRSGIQVQKCDINTKGAAPAGSSLEGIKFAIINRTGSAITNYAGKIIANGSVAQVITTNAKGYAATGAADLPIGKYTVRELRQDATFDGQNFKEGSSNQANADYDWQEQSDTVTLTDGNAGQLIYAKTFYDMPSRKSGDFAFVKKNGETGETLAYIPFKITNNTTGETHYVLTDANGNYNSSIRKTINTNANDIVLSKYSVKDAIPQSVIESLVKDTGLWFTSNGMTANDSFGALPFGNYTITEMKTEATKSMKMYSGSFTIDTDKKHIDLGVINNIAMNISTTLVTVNNDHAAEATKSVTLTDHVAYINLDAGKKYTLTGTLYVKDGDAVTALVTETVDFIPSEGKGVQNVTFTIDASNLAGKSVVAFEELTLDGEYITEHKDKDDANQTVSFPSIHTTALDIETKDHVSKADDFVTIVDSVNYTGLIVGKTYTITGTLMDADTGKEVLDDDGNTITASDEFTAAQTDGSVDITFAFSGVSLAGKTVVAFEDIYHEGVRYATHADLSDENQTVYFPAIKTKALDANTGLNQVKAEANATVVDMVTYSHLLPGKTYTMRGVLMTSAGNTLMINGQTVTASTQFTPQTPDGSVEVVFIFDASSIDEYRLVCYEYLELDDYEITSHTDSSDINQTLYVPRIKTTAISEDTKDHITEAKNDILIVDTVSYENLEVGREYTVKGILMNKSTREAILVDDKEITAETTFVPETANGTVDVTFVFDGSEQEDTVLVVFETLYTEEKEISVHADIEDDAQTVYLPKILTHAKDDIADIDHTEALPNATIIDTVSYSSLLPGKEYTVSGTLMNKETGEAVLIEGNPITASAIFTPEKSEGSVDIVFKFDASAISGTSIVSFEKVTYNGIEVGVHADINDENQTIYIPDVHTTALATDTEDHVTGANKEVTIIDEVALTGLKVGNEYTIKGILMDKVTGDELKVDGESIVSEETFIADAADMTITLIYTLNASKLAGTTTVVFETLYTEGKEVGRHHDLTDESQTVYIPEIHTTAINQATGNHDGTITNEITILDEVFYKNLIPGKEYTVTGNLMVKETGESLIVDDKEVIASKTFTAEKEDGSIIIGFTFDSSALSGKHIVAFEEVKYQGVSIGFHKNLEDENQTISFPVKPQNPPVVTGDDSTPLPYIFTLSIALLAALAVITVLVKRRKK